MVFLVYLRNMDCEMCYTRDRNSFVIKYKNEISQNRRSELLTLQVTIYVDSKQGRGPTETEVIETP